MSEETLHIQSSDRLNVGCRGVCGLLAYSAVISFLVWYNVDTFSVTIKTINAERVSCGLGLVDNSPVYCQILLYASACVILKYLLFALCQLVRKLAISFVEFMDALCSAQSAPQQARRTFNRDADKRES